MTAHEVTFDDEPAPGVRAAHELVFDGFAVLPVRGKAPLVKWKDVGGTRDHGQVTRWARELPRLDGWAVSTGSGLVVLDIDPQNGGDESNLPGALPETLTATTPKGGRHYYFTDESRALRTTAGLWPGVDVRGEGGIVVAPTGGDRTWRNEGTPLAPAPDWLVAALTAEREGAAGGDGDDYTPWQTRTTGKAPRDYALDALRAACQEVRAAPDGLGNITLNRQAFSVARYIPNGYLDKGEVRAALLEAALAIHMERQRSLDTIKSGIKGSLKVDDRTVTLVQEGTVGLGSWGAVDLTDFLAGDYAPQQPTVGRIGGADGLPLFYAARKHVVVAESEAGKTWLLLHAAHQEVADGHHVVFFDFEDSLEGVVGRMRTIGAEVDQLRSYFHYVQPDEALTPERTALVTADLAALRPTLVIVDGVTEAMTMHDWEINSNKDVAKFYRQVLNPLATSGAAVVALDHLPKVDEKKRGSIGGVHKLNGIDGAVYRLENVAQIIPGRHGKSVVSIDKDRPGQVKKHQQEKKRIAELHVWADNTDGAVTLGLEAPGAVRMPGELDEDVEEARLKRSGNEEVVLSVLAPDKQMTTSEVVHACHARNKVGKPPSRTTVVRLLKLLKGLGEVDSLQIKDEKNRDVDLWWLP